MNDLNRIQEIYEAACECSPGERAAYLEQACASDPALRAEVDGLLAVRSTDHAFLNRPLVAESALSGTRFDGYTLLEKIGSGGMGQVYLAEQHEPAHRQVAIKFIAQWGPDDELRKRFDLEQLALARMEHPYIARLYESAKTEDGRPYFVMEYIQGEPISHYCDRVGLNINGRLDLFSMVCEGVAHAHMKGVIHRDLKPSNVLVIEREGEPIPKIIDFGVAKQVPRGGNLTGQGGAVGTLRYMSPEQVMALGSTEDRPEIDVRTDVYSLCVMLYELLVGAPPLDWPNELPNWSIKDIICIKEPVPPSAYWKNVSAAIQSAEAVKRATTPILLRRTLRGDLDWILMKGLEKNVAQRYRSPMDLAAEIHRYKHNFPIAAGPPKLLYRVRKAIRRNKALLSAAALFTLLIASFLVLLLQQQGETERQRDLAMRQRDRALAVTNFLQEMFDVANPIPQHADNQPRGTAITVKEILDRAATKIHNDLQREPEIRAALMSSIGNVFGSLALYDDAQHQLETSLSLRRAMDSPDETEIAQSVADLAYIHIKKGHYTQAETLLRDAVSALAGTNSSQLAMAQRHLAWLLFERSRYDEAASLVKDALGLSLEINGERHEQTLGLIHLQASIARAQGKFPAAETGLKHVLTAHREVFGNSHLVLAQTLNEFANLHFQQAQYEESIAVFREALAILRANLNPEHPNLATMMGNLGWNLQFLGRYDEAGPLIQEALMIRQNALGADHPMVAYSLNDLATLEQNRGEFARSEQLFQEALDICQDKLADDDEQLGVVLSNFGLLYYQVGMFEKAMPFLERALIIFEKGHGENHLYVANTLNHLGRLQMALGALRAAEASIIRGREIRAGLLGETSPIYADSLVALAELHLAEAQYTKAEALLNEGLALFEKGLPSFDVRIAIAENLLGHCLAHRGLEDAAQPLLQRSFAAIRDKKSLYATTTQKALANLIQFLQGRGRVVEAAQFQTLVRPAHFSPGGGYPSLIGFNPKKR